ncbi:hypothetical protein DENIS_3484 [Desulfonema ishimotonii]|uniref:Uncharacterized protein n=1 Tax=Desulfonema ishimotonii TaxID=45657 RepID=A0A401FZU7_9BACT|nr:hypothetical protein [Desulfonema ishimotonii]GBC62512.1 hypothetical protein DENIS_3484 [Desulfonema ishimotonii]
MELSRHFKSRWQERMGCPPPTPKELEAIILDSVVIQWSRMLYRRHRRDFHRFRMLAIYWHPGLGCIIKVDNEKNMAVTCLSWRNQRSLSRDMCKIRR